MPEKTGKRCPKNHELQSSKIEKFINNSGW